MFLEAEPGVIGVAIDFHINARIRFQEFSDIVQNAHALWLDGRFTNIEGNVMRNELPIGEKIPDGVGVSAGSDTDIFEGNGLIVIPDTSNFKIDRNETALWNDKRSGVIQISFQLAIFVYQCRMMPFPEVISIGAHVVAGEVVIEVAGRYGVAEGNLMVVVSGVDKADQRVISARRQVIEFYGEGIGQIIRGGHAGRDHCIIACGQAKGAALPAHY